MYRTSGVLTLLLALTACVSTPGDWEIPIYGCWCGPNHPPEGETPDAIDVWDMACQEHDQCYIQRGRNSTACDARFVVDIEYIADAEGKIPRPLLVAYGIFRVRLVGVPYIQGQFTIPDAQEYTSFGFMAPKCDG